MLSDLFGSAAAKVAAGIGAFLLIIIGVLVWQIDVANDRAADNALAARQCEQNHARTRHSLDELEQDLARMIYEGAVREQRVQEALDAQRDRSAVLREEAAKIIAQGVVDECSTPRSVLDARGL